MAVVAVRSTVEAWSGRIVDHIVDHDQIEQAITVKVEKCRRGSPAEIHKPGAFRGVGESAVAVVEKQANAAVLRDNDVGSTVVVHVGHGHAGVEPGDIQS